MRTFSVLKASTYAAGHQISAKTTGVCEGGESNMEPDKLHLQL